jgi:lactate 2-monooxygenase
MMVRPPEHDLSIELCGDGLARSIFVCPVCPIGLVGLCAPEFQGDLAGARASATTGVPFTLSIFSQMPMENVIRQVEATPSHFQVYLPGDRELAASFIDRAAPHGCRGLCPEVERSRGGNRAANRPQLRGAR